MAKPLGDITIQSLLEDFVKAEKVSKHPEYCTLDKVIPWSGRRYKVIVLRKKWGDDSFEIHLTKLKISWLARLGPRRRL